MTMTMASAIVLTLCLVGVHSIGKTYFFYLLMTFERPMLLQKLLDHLVVRSGSSFGKIRVGKKLLKLLVIHLRSLSTPEDPG